MLLTEFHTPLRESRFPGYGNMLFKKSHYEYFVSAIARVQSEEVRKDLGEWMARAFRADSPNFQTSRFLEWVELRKQGGRHHSTGGAPKLTQKHFDYLAHLIREDDLFPRREWLANSLGSMFRDASDNFKPDYWMKACGVDRDSD